MPAHDPAAHQVAVTLVTPASGVPIDSYDDARRLLRAARQESGLSCEALAARLGCAASLVSLREGGKRVAPGDDLIAVFAVLGKRLVLVDDDRGRSASTGPIK